VSKKTWIIFVVVVFGLLAILVVSSRNANPKVDVSNVDANSIQAASASNGNIAEHVFGKADSKVILVEYGDFQCPGCGSAHPGIKTITEQYKDTVAFVFRNFPLPATTHPNAKAAAATVEAAGLQGKYWEMNNKVYENQSEWSTLTGAARTDMFVSYAKALGLDTAKFTTDMSSSTVNQKVSFDKAIGDKIGVDSTPTFYVNGVKVASDVIQDVQTGNGDKLRAILNTDLTKAGSTPPATTN
jgi:protein-disulfide isomerase